MPTANKGVIPAANKALLTPFLGKSPAGCSLYYDSLYDLIREARREDNPHLSQGIWATDLKKADWPQVERLCCQALTKQSKDLQIALWLVEAWVMQRGWSALAEGFLFLRDFAEAHWTTMYPQIAADGGMEHRLSPLFLFAEKMPDKLVLLPLGTSAVTLSSWRMAQYQSKIDKQTNDGLQQLMKNLLSIPHDAVQELHATLNSAEEALKSFCTTLDTLSHDAGPSFKSISGIFQEAKALLVGTLKRSQSSSEISTQQLGTPRETDLSEDQALQELKRLVVFFEKHVAQSPIPLLLKSALVVAQHPLDTLMEQAPDDTEAPIVCITRLWTMLKRLEA
ncbi:MAG: type VI secretion system ImpA family N-terminal domain-containing protein [Holosporales bacterium]|jgi:type VI secretion system ImpA family protein|nr:type VI secretion system ImpA family N-terminal domain-containing protein [Holosporales bacterium]